MLCVPCRTPRADGPLCPLRLVLLSPGGYFKRMPVLTKIAAVAFVSALAPLGYARRSTHMRLN